MNTIQCTCGAVVISGQRHRCSSTPTELRCFEPPARKEQDLAGALRKTIIIVRRDGWSASRPSFRREAQNV